MFMYHRDHLYDQTLRCPFCGGPYGHYCPTKENRDINKNNFFDLYKYLNKDKEDKEKRWLIK